MSQHTADDTTITICGVREFSSYDLARVTVSCESWVAGERVWLASWADYLPPYLLAMLLSSEDARVRRIAEQRWELLRPLP